MALEPEEQAALDRERRRCEAENDRLRALSGNAEARAQLDDDWSPLLRRPPLPPTVCTPPYVVSKTGETPELLP